MESTEKPESTEDEKVQCEDHEPPRAPTPSPSSIARDAKVATIREACRWKEVEKLRALATSEGGLVLDEVRRQACSCTCGWAFDLSLTIEHRANIAWVHKLGYRCEARG
jgi:hypothetical protein